MLDLSTLRLRRFGAKLGKRRVLIVAPYSLHDAKIADFAHGHSLVAMLKKAGFGPIYLSEWRSAVPSQGSDSIDTLLADVDRAVDAIGADLDVVGICQGGWMALIYAARFPTKVRKLVIAGAPIDLRAGRSALSLQAETTPRAAFTDLVAHGHGVLRGEEMLALWGPARPPASYVAEALQVDACSGAEGDQRLADRFRAWYGTVLDLPGTYYLQVVDWLYRENRIATGEFVALGQRVDLAHFARPLFLLAARGDKLVAVEQMMSVKRLVATPPEDVGERVVDGSHLSLFLGQRTLGEVWPDIAAWLQPGDQI